MPFKDPLTADQLRAIQARQPWNPDVIALLWEVSRLRSYPRRLNQMSGYVERPHGIIGQVFDGMMEDVATEPCVKEHQQTVGELLEPPRTLRKGMEPR